MANRGKSREINKEHLTFWPKFKIISQLLNRPATNNSKNGSAPREQMFTNRPATNSSKNVSAPLNKCCSIGPLPIVLKMFLLPRMNVAQ